jgi:hypothetical protein
MAQDAADLDLHRQVAGRPDVGPPLGEQQIDLGRPAADALDPGERGDRLLVVFGQIREIEPAAGDFLGKAAGIAAFWRERPAARSVSSDAAHRARDRSGRPAPASLFQIDCAAATLTCWPMIVRSKVSYPRSRMRGGDSRRGPAPRRRRARSRQRVERCL